MTADEILWTSKNAWKRPSRAQSSLAGIRTGRANPGLVDSLRVEVYGSPVPIKQLASVGAPEPTQIVIRPFDPGTIKDIEKAIQASDLGFNPQNDGRVIRLNVPPLVDGGPPQDGRPDQGSLSKRPRSRSAISAATATRRPTRRKKTRISPKTIATRPRTKSRTSPSGTKPKSTEWARPAKKT